MNNLNLTENAIEYFKSILNKEAISLDIKNSGCSGYAYIMKTIKISDDNKNDIIIIKDIPFYFNNETKGTFNNCEIDYKKEGFNSKIVFNNPNAINHCGCGESFNIKK